ncbi:hypothetical protein MSMAC_2467 [Methanosarcina mazei C16]|uniref:Helicase ATP-binding domain-containing protein n=1 Tax=Methanosarcina mazei C16 TaxID=1434113 RepID=A0A0E3S0E9_METMZ|nr:DEAD/DEAH box helicase family protein [Methanosarcina mazei]AKB72357.1 hypothetical protein MSMAC_2467 [Methanosarcina mazei C16]
MAVRGKKIRARKTNGKKKILLDDYLVLNSYMLNLFGMKSFDDLKEILKQTEEGFDEEGRSYMFHALYSLKKLEPGLKSRLEDYDSNIKEYMEHINQNRETPIKLKYFQYLAVLFGEIYFDRYFSGPIPFMNELNTSADAFIEEHTGPLEEADYGFIYSKDDLRNLAFWMATGSGKTFLVQLNYLQFMKYNRGKYQINFDNILLITPNENLSIQHIEDMKKSRIPCMPFENTGLGAFSKFADENTIKVVDIHKLTDEKKGSGITVDIENFGTKNLVFVDEGHKGSSGKKWRFFREELTSEGFKIEYSATFGQAVASGNGEGQKLLHEYGKSILFDYSYRFFYSDGYGKEYKILNLKDKAYSEEIKHKLMLVNVLSFYQQKKIFNEYREEALEYNIAEPLWIFVGSSVQGTGNQSDIFQVVSFIGKFLKNADNWAINTIKAIYDGNSGLVDPEGMDIFSPHYPEQRLEFLRKSGASPEETYADILKQIFHASGSAPLYLVNIKSASGEIALKCGIGKYFGIINIGDDAQFLKLVEKECGDPAAARVLNLRIDSDDISSSLFRNINSNDSNINILIGAKKFIEGWNSWRVSNMGLLNIGKSEGSQIIQLFGRGVRLKGKNMSLKRSTAADEYPSEQIPALETINIFGVEANYMDQFKDYLRTEGVPVENRIEIPIKIKINDEYLKEDLLIPDYSNEEFKNQIFELTIDEDLQPVEVDLYPKVDIIESRGIEGIRANAEKPIREIKSPEIDLLDWTRIYYEILELRVQKSWSNIYFSEKILKEIIGKGKNVYNLKCPENIAHPRKFEDIWELEEAVISILKKYLQKYYYRQKNSWTNKNFYLTKLDGSNGNFAYEEFRVSINEKEMGIIQALQEIEEQSGWEEFLQGNKDNEYISNVFFDKHIYQPLMFKKQKNSSKYTIQPSGLNPGEAQFIKHLKEHLQDHVKIFHGSKIFVLRNLPKLGVKFFDTVNFFPDFIIWIKKEDNVQHLLFVDPKGLVHTDGFRNEKIQLCHRIKDTEVEINKKLKEAGSAYQVKLDSFIVSVTSKREVENVFGVRSSTEYEKNHILFQEDKNYIGQMFDSIF